MQMYFNQFDFLNNAVGIKSASYVYFGKNSPSELNLQEAALLVGMCKNPSYYNPLRYPERAKGRRNLVLEKMAEAGYLTQADCEKAKQTEIVLAYHKVSHNEGFAPYLREEVKRMMMAKRPQYKDYPTWNKNASMPTRHSGSTTPSTAGATRTASLTASPITSTPTD
jgi:penicillin-binding protein 1A